MKEIGKEGLENTILSGESEGSVRIMAKRKSNTKLLRASGRYRITSEEVRQKQLSKMKTVGNNVHIRFS